MGTVTCSPYSKTSAEAGSHWDIHEPWLAAAPQDHCCTLQIPWIKLTIMAAETHYIKSHPTQNTWTPHTWLVAPTVLSNKLISSSLSNAKHKFPGMHPFLRLRPINFFSSVFLHRSKLKMPQRQCIIYFLKYQTIFKRQLT